MNKKLEIWALFSVANDYNQPDNNLEAFWSKKPTYDQLMSISSGDIEINKLLKCGESRERGGTKYSLCLISENTKL